MAVYAWGFAKLGQLGTDAVEASLTPMELKIPVLDDRVAQIYTGGLFTALVTQKGDLYVCGCGRHGRLGTGSEDDVFSLTKIEIGKDTKVGQISAGSWHTCAVTYLGRLYSWGYNSKHNVLGRDCDQKFSLTPGLVPSLMMTKIRQVSCGHNFTLVCTKQGEVYSWGCGRYGVLGHGNEECQLHPKKIEALDTINVKTVAAGYAHCAAITDDGRVYVFGKGCDGALGLGPEDLSNRSEPIWLQSLISYEIEQISCSKGEHRGHTLAVTADGLVFAWGSNYKGKLGVGDQENRFSPCRIPEEFFDFQPIAQISAGGIHSAAITRDGFVYTWGSGKDGRLGHLEMESPTKHTYCSARPKKVELLPNEERRATQISCSHYHTVALMELRG